MVLSLEAALSGCTSLRTWNFRVTLSAVPFLTLEDPNAKIKGSRDPLDVQPIWSAFVRNRSGFYTNITTIFLAQSS